MTIYLTYMNKIPKHLLKRLINEVLTELEDMGVEPELKGTSHTTKNFNAANRHKDDTIITMVSRGVKPNKGFKKAMAAMAYAAKLADLDIIHGEVARDGNKLAFMDAGDLKDAAKQFGSDDKAFKPTGEKGKINMARLSPEQRLAMIEPGEKENEWNQATEKDLANAREKLKLKRAKIEAGTYDKNDTTLWSDREWDAYNILISKEGAPADSRKWNESQWASFDSHVKSKIGDDGKATWSPNHSTKTDKLANVGAGLGHLNQNG